VLLLKRTIKIKTRKEIDKMKKIFYLKSCSTNQRILKELNLEGVELQNIKDENIDEKSLDFLKDKMGSYEALFSKKAMKFRSLGLNEMSLSEADYKKHILEEYTFLKRPYMINGDEVFIGNAKNVVEAAVHSFNS
jgi:arsenate reductase